MYINSLLLYGVHKINNFLKKHYEIRKFSYRKSWILVGIAESFNHFIVSVLSYTRFLQRLTRLNILVPCQHISPMSLENMSLQSWHKGTLTKSNTKKTQRVVYHSKYKREKILFFVYHSSRTTQLN